MSQGTINEHSIEVFINHPIVWWMIVGLLAGWLAGVVTRGRGFGCLADIVIGLVGAVIGGWVFSKLGILWECGCGYRGGGAVGGGGAVVFGWGEGLGIRTGVGELKIYG
jgi:uncharacterized membrane protein YeaQ/YmgE (transglycosylase-associated protein family)